MGYGYAVTNRLKSAGPTLYARQSGVNNTIATASYLTDGWLGKNAAIGTLANNDSIVIAFSSAQSLVGFALLNHNLVTAGGAGTSVTVKGADDAAISLNVVTAKAASTLNSTVPVPKTKDHVLLFPAVSKQYWQLLITGMGASPAVTMGELFALTSLTSLTRGSVYGSSNGGLDIIKSAVSMQYGEQRNIFLGGPVREENYRWADWSASQTAEASALYEACVGGVTPFLWCESVNSTASAATAAEQACIFGNLLVDKFLPVQDDYNVNQLPTFTMRSLGREAGA